VHLPSWRCTSQRHITPNATEEILCGGPHKISQIQGVSSGSFDTGKHSIGSRNDACVLGNDVKRARIFPCIAFFRKTKPGRIINSRVWC